MARPSADGGTQTSTTLLNRVAAVGDEEACRLFVARYGPMVAGLAAGARMAREDVEDVVQEVMIAAVEALRAERYDRNLGRFKHWLKGVVRHKITDALNRDPRRHPKAPVPRIAGVGEAVGPRSDPPANVGSMTRPTVGGEIDPTFRPIIDPTAVQGLAGLLEMPDPHPTPADEFEREFERQWRLTAIEQALDEVRVAVDPATYQAFDLYVLKHRPPGEVGRLLGLSRNAVYIAKTRILERLRELLTRANPPYPGHCFAKNHASAGGAPAGIPTDPGVEQGFGERRSGISRVTPLPEAHGGAREVGP